MPAVQETIERVRRIDVDQYKYGFVTDIESDKAPKGLSEDIVRFISAKKTEPEWMLAWRLDAYRRWLTMREPTWARVDYPKIDYQDYYYYSAPKKKALASLDEVDPEILKTYEKLGIPLREQEILAGVVRRADGERALARRGRRGVRFGVGRHHLPGGAEEGRRDLHADLGGAARASRSGEEVSRHGGADHRQLLRHAQFGGVLRRLVRLRAAGRALPDGAVDLFPHQREKHRPVRAHADHRRQGLLRELSRGLHRADARREPAARRGGRAGRARRRRDQVFDGAELVSGRRRTARAASTTSSPSAATAAATARRFPGPRSRPARRSPGSIRAASCAATIPRGEFYSIAISQRPPAGRQRHQDAAPRQEHDEPDHLQGHRGRQIQQHLPRPGDGASRAPRARATSPTATRF